MDVPPEHILQKRIELMEETHQFQLQQNDALLQRIDRLSSVYNDKIKEHTELLREQFKDTLRDYTKRQTNKYQALETTCSDLQNEIARIKEQAKLNVDRAVEKCVLEYKARLEEQQQQHEDTRQADLAQLALLKETNLKQGCTIALLRQQLTDQAVEHSTRLVELKKYEQTVADQLARIDALQRALEDQQKLTEVAENRIKVLAERLSNLNVPDDFVEREKDLLSQITVLTRKLDIANRSIDNWNNRYRILEMSCARKPRNK